MANLILDLVLMASPRLSLGEPVSHAGHSRVSRKKRVPYCAYRSPPGEVPVKSKRDEEKWQKAKAIAKQKGDGENYALIMGIYKRMKPDYFKEAAVRVARMWFVAKLLDFPLSAISVSWWQKFLDEKWEGGKQMVRNTNPDTRDQYPEVQMLTLMRTDRTFNERVIADFERWQYLRQQPGGPRGPRILRARRDAGLWERFLADVYDGGKKLVRNTNRDTRDRYPQVEASTLLKTDRKFRKLLRGQFDRWRAQREKQGPSGKLVEELGALQRGQRIEWSSGQDVERGVVERARPDRAILKTEDGRTVHMRPWDVPEQQPRIV